MGPDVEEIRARLPMLRLLEHDGVEMRRSGPNLVGLCPFHQEKSGSFTVHAASPDHAHCYGCGWHGDIFAYWSARLSSDFVTAKASLATLAGFTAEDGSQKSEIKPKKMASVTHSSDERKEKPALPTLRALVDEEIGELAHLRGLSREGIATAADARRVGFCRWPQFQSGGGPSPYWEHGKDAAPCWVVTDKERRVAQFRRLDGKPFVRHDGREIKAWTKGSPTWPIGASEIGERVGVLLVEGGADMLAAFHFLRCFGRTGRVAVVAMLGASMRMTADALPFFAPSPAGIAKRVRILMDEDEAGAAAARRWTEQLTSVGAAVETFSLGGLTQVDGRPVKDLNDLARCEPAVWQSADIRAAFFDFDF
jgi:hypothetical protein